MHIGFRASDAIRDAIASQAGKKSTALKALVLIGLAESGHDMRPLVLDLGNVLRAQGLDERIRQRLQGIYNDILKGAPHTSPPPATPKPKQQRQPNPISDGLDFDTGGQQY